MVMHPKLSGKGRKDIPVQAGSTVKERIEELQALVVSWREQARMYSRQASEDRERGLRDSEIRHDERMIALDKCADELAKALKGAVCMTRRIARGPFDRWYIFHPGDARLAWSEWGWVPFVCNFQSEQEAVEHGHDIALCDPFES